MTAATATLPLDGPHLASQSLSFEVPGEPQPQGSSRAFKHRHTGRVMVTSDNARLRPWRDAVCWHARQAMAGGRSLAGPVGVTIEFSFARPAGHFGKRGLRPSAPPEHVVRPDLDKLVRAVLDALSEAGVWRDDAQVTELVVRKKYDDLPFAMVEVTARDAGGLVRDDSRPPFPTSRR
ncbi:MAG TPA: RusA family crossover junction endodeoxyribonuclease [Candidatus Dormibacteraeota bacterium]|nr:RusA family crossover junction endodeoxyribonuclease [Candidatus Dormibacteraeota bacterium]